MHRRWDHAGGDGGGGQRGSGHPRRRHDRALGAGVQHHRSKRLVVVGAGPIGLAAALGAQKRGFDTIVLEAEEVGAALLHWGSTRFFTPQRMNFPGAAGEELLTGPEFVERTLIPAAAELDVRTHTRVTSIARRGLTRTD